MVKVSYDQKPYRRSMMQIWGGTRRRQPERRTPIPAARSWPRIRTRPVSLGIAISEAVEDAATREDTKYSLGSVLNHVLLHQTVIGLEATSRWRWPASIPTS